MSVYKKLQSARIKLLNTKLTKSGQNKFAGFSYFEMEDFVPAIQRICDEVGLCGVVSFTPNLAYLNIYDTDSDGVIVFSSPMSTAALKGVHEIQNLGAVQSYLRRYLWIAAFEICEHDALDAVVGKEPVKAAAPKPVAKPESKTEPKTSSGIPIVTEKPTTTEGWEISVSGQESGTTDWFEAIWAGSVAALSLANSNADVMSIFKVNKILFDEAKAIDPEWFKKLMAEFTKVKDKYKEQK